MSYTQKILNLQGQPLNGILPVQSYIQYANNIANQPQDHRLIQSTEFQNNTPIRHNLRSVSPGIRQEELTPTKQINITTLQDPSNAYQRRIEITRQINLSPPRKHPILNKNSSVIGTNASRITNISQANNNISLANSSFHIQQQQQSMQPIPIQAGYQQININQKLDKFYQTLDSVALLGQEFETMLTQLNQAQNEINAWEQKCNLIKTVASTPPPVIKGNHYQQFRIDITQKLKEYAIQVQQLTSNMSELTLELNSQMSRVQEMENVQIEKSLLEQKYAELRETQQSTEELLISVKEQLQQRDQENSEMSQKIKQMGSNVQMVETEVQKLQDIVVDREARIKEQVENIEQISLTENQLRNENQQLRSDNEKFAHELESIASTLVNNNSSITQNFSFNNGGRGNTLQQVLALKDTVMQSKVDMEKIQQENLNLQSKIESLINENEQLSALLSESKQSLDELKELKIKQQQIIDESVQTSNIQMQQEFEERLQAQRTEAAAHLSQQMEALRIETTNIVQQQMELKSQQDLMRLQEQMESISQENERVKRGYDQLQEEYSEKLNQVTESLNIRIQRLQQDLESTSLAEQELIKERNKAVEDLNELRAQATHLHEYRVKYKNLKKELRELKHQFDEYRQAFIKEITTKFDMKSSVFEQQIDTLNLNAQDSDQERIKANINIKQTNMRQSSINQYNYQNKQSYTSDNANQKKQIKPNQKKNIGEATSGYKTDLSLNNEDEQQNSSSQRVKTEGGQQQHNQIQQSQISVSNQNQYQQKLQPSQQQQIQQVYQSFSQNQSLPYRQGSSMMSEQELQILQQKYQSALSRINNQINTKYINK